MKWICIILVIVECNSFSTYKTVNLDNFGVHIRTCHTPTFDNFFCKCNKGQTLKSGNCVDCEGGKFKDVIGNFACETCPVNSTSLQGAKSIFECLCEPGHTKINGICSKCEQKSYKSYYGNSECNSCVSNSVTMTSGSISNDECICDKGFQGINGISCIECGLGTYNEEYGQINCKLCPVNTYSSNTANVNILNCTTCGENRNSNGINGLTSFDDCICDAGYYKKGGICVQCPENSYCEIGQDIRTCTAQSASPLSSKNKSSCVCDPGYYQSGDECAPCTNGFYCINGIRYECENDSYSEPLSSSENDCICENGFHKLYSSTTTQVM